MVKKSRDKKISAPFWLHISGIFLWLVLLVLVNLLGYLFLGGGIVRGVGILILIWVLIAANTSYKNAIKNNKNPYAAYFLTVILYFIGLITVLILWGILVP